MRAFALQPCHTFASLLKMSVFHIGRNWVNDNISKINHTPCSVPYPAYLRDLLKNSFKENHKNQTVATR